MIGNELLACCKNPARDEKFCRGIDKSDSSPSKGPKRLRIKHAEDDNISFLRSLNAVG
jgi:hypothetical protein